MLTNILPRYQTKGNGSTKVFSTTFSLLDSSFVNVYIDSQKQTNGYTVDTSNNKVTFTTAPASGKLITIVRIVPIDWPYDNLGTINKDSLDKIFTYLTAKMQTLEEALSRSPKSNVYDTETGEALSESFLQEMRDALDSLSQAQIIYTQVQASGTQALTDITNEKNTAISTINTNAVNKTNEFNTNATNKTNTFNTNAANKQALVDAKATEAANSARAAAVSAEEAAESAASIDAENILHLDKISNCILEIPQNIKMTIENNVLTLKAGSILTRTGSTYATHTTISDYTVNIDTLTDYTYVQFSSIGGLQGTGPSLSIERIGSGSSLPATHTYDWFFLTTDKYIYYWDSSSSSYQIRSTNWCYPLCVVTVKNGVASFAKDSNGNDMIFNGAGFIGHHAFVYPGVSVLVGNKFNDNRSLKSIYRETDTLQIIDLGNGINRCLSIRNNNQASVDNGYHEVDNFDDIGVLNNNLYYIKNDNFVYIHQNNGNNPAPRTMLVLYSASSGTVTDFTIRQPVRLATTEMLDKKQDTITLTANRAVISNSNGKLSTSEVTNTELYYLHNATSNIQTQLNSKQDKATAINYDNITNCITYIPQDIKLELNNGTLTLKAGSKVYVPNGTGVFDVLTITSDLTQSSFSTGVNTEFYLFRYNGYLRYFNKTQISSGSTAPSGNDYLVWYDTTNNIIKTSSDGGSTWNSGVSLPLCKFTATSNTITSIDQVFNGFGYIGSTVFALPGVKGLIPNGRNADGSLKNIVLNINQVQTNTIGANRTTGIRMSASGSFDFNSMNYNEKDNYNYMGEYSQSSVRTSVVVASVKSDNNAVITSLQPKTAFHAVDYNDFAPVKAQVDINTTALTTKANVGLDNLNADGQMIVDSQNGAISNCILEIPQNIKLTLENNVLTLKSGSILTSTGSTYGTYTTSSDITLTISSSLADGRYELFTTGYAFHNPRILSKISSGNSSSFPTTDLNDYNIYFNTDDKLLYGYNYSTQQWVVNWTTFYPVCCVDIKSGVASFAKGSHGNDMIFNGAGFIGHHAFVYPNVKGLIPDGFNTDGSLANIDKTNNGLIIVELQSPYKDIFFSTYSNVLYVNTFGGSVKSEENLPLTNVYYYITNSNAVGRKNGQGIYSKSTAIPLARYNYDGTTVTDFTIRQPVRLATTEMLDNVQSQVDTNTASISGKQDTLVSGTNIKTINLTSLLGSGNISTVQSWGQITGTLSNQTDLNDALALKANLSMFQTAESVPSTFTDGVWLAVFETPLNS